MENLEEGWVEITVKTSDGSIDTVRVKAGDWDTMGDTLTAQFDDGDSMVSINYPLRSVMCYTTRRIYTTRRKKQHE